MNAKSKEAGYKVFVPKLTAKMLRSGFQKLLNMPNFPQEIAKPLPRASKMSPRCYQVGSENRPEYPKSPNMPREISRCSQDRHKMRPRSPQRPQDKHKIQRIRLGSVANKMRKSVRPVVNPRKLDLRLLYAPRTCAIVTLLSNWRITCRAEQ